MRTQFQMLLSYFIGFLFSCGLIVATNIASTATTKERLYQVVADANEKHQLEQNENINNDYCLCP